MNFRRSSHSRYAREEAREKLNKVSAESAAMITTVWGVGYKLEVPK